MFTRETMQRIENEMAQSGPNIARLEGMSRGVFSVLQMLIASLAIPAQLWAAGVGKAIEIAPEDGKPAGSQYTRRWWLALQMALAVFTVAMKTPIGVLAGLETAEGVRPFAVFDPAVIAPEFLGMTLERLVYSDPETDVPPTVLEEQPV